MSTSLKKYNPYDRMELRYPSICYILGMVLFVWLAYLFESRMTPYILALVSGGLLFLASQQHYSQFYMSEYKAETWTEKLRQASPYYFFSIVISLAILIYVLTSTSIGESIISSLGFGSLSAPAPIQTPQMGGGVKQLYETLSRNLRSILS